VHAQTDRPSGGPLEETSAGSSRAAVLARAVGKIESGHDPDAVIAELEYRCGSDESVIPGAYLEALPRSAPLNRSPAGHLLDLCARACVDARSRGERVAVFAAHGIRSSRAYRRLGYRNEADYAREELGMTVRSFRDLARLGRRLSSLPGVRTAYLEGTITRTQAAVIAAIAVPDDEARWLGLAEAGTVRQLKRAAREARAGRRGEADRCTSSERSGESSTATTKEDGEAVGEDGAAVGEDGESVGVDEEPVGDNVEAVEEAVEENEEAAPPRERLEFQVPAPMLGEIDAVLELASRVAAMKLPAGTPWAIIAAEYLSGTAPIEPVAEPSDVLELRPLAAPDPGPSRRRACPEDPTGRQEYLEGATGAWKFLPKARLRVRTRGSTDGLTEAAGELAGAAAGPDSPHGSADGGEPSISDSPWELHRRMNRALEQERTVDWQLGRLLSTIRNRRLWRDMWFSSFAHYVRERLGISARHAQRLVRADRLALEVPAFAEAWKRGVLSVRQAELLARVLPFVAGESNQRAWIETARRSTFDRLSALVRCVERMIAVRDRDWRDSEGMPSVAESRLREAQIAAGRVRRGERAPTDTTTFLTGAGCEAATATSSVSPAGGNGPSATMFVARYGVWMTPDERQTLALALAAARNRAQQNRERKSPHGRRSPPLWVCLSALLDAFVAEYGGARSADLCTAYPILERDHWQCRVPGCRAVSSLHTHHIVFRSRGGGDEPENLVVLCDWHHRALHEGWIRCVGKAPDELYWELGCGRRFGEAPVARFLGERRLRDDEYWDGVAMRKAIHRINHRKQPATTRAQP